LEQKDTIIKEYEEFYTWMDENLSEESSKICKEQFMGIINSMKGEP